MIKYVLKAVDVEPLLCHSYVIDNTRKTDDNLQQGDFYRIIINKSDLDEAQLNYIMERYNAFLHSDGALNRWLDYHVQGTICLSDGDSFIHKSITIIAHETEQSIIIEGLFDKLIVEEST